MQSALRADALLPADQRVRGWEAPRRTLYLGRWHLHGGWVPDREIRLYDRERGRWEGGLHANIHVDGPVSMLHHYYYHYTYRNISDQLATIDRYSTTAAEEMIAAGKRHSLFKLVASPLARFFRDFFLKGGFREGLPGFIVAVNTMFYAFVKRAKAWEARQNFPPFGDRDALP